MLRFSNAIQELLPYMITVIEEAMCDEHDREVVTQLYSTMLSALQRIIMNRGIS